MAITADDVRKIAKLAHLEITEKEVEIYTPQMAGIVEYVEQLNSLETQDVATALGGMTPESIATDTRRADEPHNSLGQELALREAPAAESGHFRVPKVL